MPSLNKVQLIGHVGADPSVRLLPEGQMASFRLAVSERWRSRKSGQLQESTEWFSIVLYAGLAEVAAQHIRKGTLLYVEGKQRTQCWIDRETGEERQRVVVVGSQIQMLGRPKNDVAHEEIGQEADDDVIC